MGLASVKESCCPVPSLHALIEGLASVDRPPGPDSDVTIKPQEIPAEVPNNTYLIDRPHLVLPADCS